MHILHVGSQSEFVKLLFPEQKIVGLAEKRNAYEPQFYGEAQVSIAVEGFTGAFMARIDSNDFLKFEDELHLLYQNLQGSATLRPLEKQLTLHLIGNGRGAITVTGTAYSMPTYRNHLEFTFEIDQTFLPPLLAQLSAITGSSPH